MPVETTVGKRIRLVGCHNYSSTIVIYFEDQTYSAISAHVGHDDDVYLAEDEDFDHLLYYQSDWLIEHGIATLDEINEAHRQREDRAKLRVEVIERAQYERLRAKYGPER